MNTKSPSHALQRTASGVTAGDCSSEAEAGARIRHLVIRMMSFKPVCSFFLAAVWLLQTHLLAEEQPRLIPKAMAHRMEERDNTRKLMGGSDKSEKAVLAGLRWLKNNQNEDGSWASEQEPAMTGLALLCFLGHGELSDSPEFGLTFQKGIDWLLTNGAANHGLLSMEKGRRTNAGVYHNGIATYALAEYYAMTRDERAKDLLIQAVGYIVKGQAPDGGWQYWFAKGPESDTSVSGWQIQALHAAHLTGLAIPGVSEALDSAMRNLRRVYDGKGNFGYRRPGDRGDDPSLAGVGVYGTLLWKADWMTKNDPLIRDGINFILTKAKKEYPLRYHGEKAHLHSWYYHTYACRMHGDETWQQWSRLLQDELINAQNPDASWPPTGNRQVKGALEAKPDGIGPVYRTTLCILMLEAFYRYHPVPVVPGR